MGRHPTSFLPSRDAFAFNNSWPPAPGVSVRVPFGRIGVGNAAAGLCGGMAFAALDYWHAGLTPPAGRPAAGTPLYRFIVRRIVDSWDIPVGVLRYYAWMNLPDGEAGLQLPHGDAGFQLPGRGVPALAGLRRRTLERHWPRARDALDHGSPVVLGLVTVASARPGRLRHNHQVLAYGYRASGTAVTIQVYDPNSGQDDDVRITFDTVRPAGFDHNVNIGWPLRGFFLTRYSPAMPPGVAS